MRCEVNDAVLRLGPAGCLIPPIWLVAVGTRHSDAQYSCGRHLNRTCEAMLGAEGREAALTLRRIGS
jgi:hypothetical protein